MSHCQEELWIVIGNTVHFVQFRNGKSLEMEKSLLPEKCLKPIPGASSNYDHLNKVPTFLQESKQKLTILHNQF